jgi:hypothetical protein
MAFQFAIVLLATEPAADVPLALVPAGQAK